MKSLFNIFQERKSIYLNGQFDFEKQILTQMNFLNDFKAS